MICIWVLHQSDQAFNHILRIQSGHPVILDGLSADLSSVLLDVRVKDLRLEVYLWCLEGVVVREIDVDNEVASLIWRVLWPNDSCVPVGQVISYQSDANTLDRLVVVQVCQFLLQKREGIRQVGVFDGYLVKTARRLHDFFRTKIF